MALSMITALEIFTNPKDLDFQVGKSTKVSGKFIFAISRGPGHGFKLLIDTEPVFSSVEEAVKALKHLLEGICQAATAEIKRPGSVASFVANPENRPIEEATNALTQEEIETICRQLLESGHTQTY